MRGQSSSPAISYLLGGKRTPLSKSRTIPSGFCGSDKPLSNILDSSQEASSRRNDRIDLLPLCLQVSSCLTISTVADPFRTEASGPRWIHYCTSADV